MFFQKILRHPSLLHTSKRFYNAFIDALEGGQVVPDVLPNVPADELTIAYMNKLKIAKEVSPRCLEFAPTSFHVPGLNQKDLHSIIMTDPDQPSRQLSGGKEFIHWLVVNIPGNKLDKGKPLFDYVPPIPKQGSGCHRLVFALIKQNCKINVAKECVYDNKTRRGRYNFSIRKYICKKRLPNPLAATYIFTKYMRYVDIFVRRLEDGEIEEDFNKRANRPPFYCPPQKPCKN